MAKENYFYAYKGIDNHRKWCVESIKTKRTKIMMKVMFRDVTFVVNEIGRQKMISEKKQNVHAKLKGIIDLSDHKKENWIEISYDPYHKPFFFRKDTGEYIHSAKKVLLLDSKSFAVF
jgi:hypothetical protein